MATSDGDTTLYPQRNELITPRVAYYWDNEGQFWLAVYMDESTVTDCYTGSIIYPIRYRSIRSLLKKSLFLENEQPFESLTAQDQGLVWEALLLLG